MLCKEIIAVCSEIRTMCGQNAEFFNVKLVVQNVTAGHRGLIRPGFLAFERTYNKELLIKFESLSHYLF
jgi:hypothetical protein